MEKQNNMYINKVIVIDWSIFLKMSTSASENCDLNPTFIAMTMILGNLKKIGLEPDDLVIIACDGRHNWRKKYIEQTKVDRAEGEKKFQERHPGIYQKFDELLMKLDRATDWHILKFDELEADDIMACASKYFGDILDRPVVLLTMDSDMAQLWHYLNVKWFSPHRQMKRYKIKPDNFNVIKLIAKMVLTKGHNNLGVPQNDEEYKIKKLCTDLIHLPEWIENTCFEAFKELQPKEEHSELLGSPTLIERYNSLYNDTDKIVTYEKSVKIAERKKKKKQKKKLKTTVQK